MDARALLDILRLLEERLLHMLARDRNDPDWGCFATRREVRELPLLQCLVHPLAALVSDRALESPLYGEEIPIRWAKAALFSLPLMQERSGAYGEGGGRLFTPLLAYHGALALRELKPFLTAEETRRLEASLARAASYARRRLAREGDYLRLAEAALALHETFRLTGDRALGAAADDALVRLCRMQGAEGNLHTPGSPFDVKRHMILAELLARRHFIDKSAASRGVLKPLLHLLRHLQRPDGSVEQETFGGEDFFAPPGALLSIRRELPDADALAGGLLEATGRLGRRTLPFLDRRTFAVTLTRLITSIRLLGEPARGPEPPPPPPPERRVFFASLPALVVTTPAYRAFVNPAAGRVKVYSRLRPDGPLVYADSGFALEADGTSYAPLGGAGEGISVGDDRIGFALRLEGPRGRLPFSRPALVKVDRTLSFADDGVRLHASFDPGGTPFRAAPRLFRVHRRLNRSFSPDDLAIATREDVAAHPAADGRSWLVAEVLRLDGERFKLSPDEASGE